MATAAVPSNRATRRTVRGEWERFTRNPAQAAFLADPAKYRAAIAIIATKSAVAAVLQSVKNRLPSSFSGMTKPSKFVRVNLCETLPEPSEYGIFKSQSVSHLSSLRKSG